MENPDILKQLIESGGAVGAVVVGLIIGAGTYLRHLSNRNGNGGPPRLATEFQTKIEARLSSIDGRLRDVEHDLTDRPTRSELHEVVLSMTVQAGKIDALTQRVSAIGSGVTRIEDFMYDYATKQKKG